MRKTHILKILALAASIISLDVSAEGGLPFPKRYSFQNSCKNAHAYEYAHDKSQVEIIAKCKKGAQGYIDSPPLILSKKAFQTTQIYNFCGNLQTTWPTINGMLKCN